MVKDSAFIYQIKRSQRTTKTRIVVRPGKVEVVTSFGVSEKQIGQFVQAKQQWIVQALEKMAALNKADLPPVPIEYHDGTVILYRGQQYPLTVKATTLKRVRFEFSDQFIAHVPTSLPVEQRHADIKNALIQWFKKQILIEVKAIVAQYAKQKKLLPNSINIKAQKSRWGSCGVNNDININWLLILAPPEILEYVVVHELCHIQVRNHSREFWRLVEELMPNYQHCCQWLKNNGHSLMRFHD